jgi:hypothetical protein
MLDKRLPSAFVIISALLTTLDQACAQNDFPKFSPQLVQANPYAFTYDSGVRPSPDQQGFQFIRCVETRNQQSFQVDWTKAGVRGWVAPGAPSVYEFPALSDAATLVDPADLWYGPQPMVVNAPFREKTATAQAQVNVDPATQPDRKSPALKSRVRTSVPRRQAKVFAETGGLTPIDIEFTATVAWRNGSYVYEYLCVGAMPAQAERPVKLRFQSPTVNRAVVGDRQPGAALEMSRDDPRWFGRVTSTAKPRYGATVMEFLDEAGEKVVATAPVAIYDPEAPAR